MPWDNPLPLTRAWCVFELYACAHTDSNFQVAMTRVETNRFLNGIRNDPSNFFEMLAKVNSKKSTSFHAQDKINIHEAIDRTIGFVAMDGMKFRVFKKWMLVTLNKQINVTESEKETIEHADWLRALGRMHFEQGEFKIAEPYYINCLERFTKILGPDHNSTLIAINNLALLYKVQGSYNKAEPLYLDCLSRTKRILGEDHHDTIVSIHNLADFYHSQGKYEAAKELYLDCFDRFKRMGLNCLERQCQRLGEVHPDTLLTKNCLAMLYDFQGKYELAQPLFQECLQQNIRLLGENHKNTLTVKQSLAVLYTNQGKYHLAEPLCLDCFETQSQIFTLDHQITLSSMSNLSWLYYLQGKYEKSATLYEKCLEKSLIIRGEIHPDTLLLVNNLAIVYKLQGKYQRAEKLFLDCVEKTSKILGADHPNSFSLTNNLASLYKMQGKYLYIWTAVIDLNEYWVIITLIPFQQ
ncbi:Kinesin light chain 3 [Nowakowskiella sp. JEL0078]|nr:Kinesin light chain 3 [Nowakowskiella sp. JEL0078]